MKHLLSFVILGICLTATAQQPGKADLELRISAPKTTVKAGSGVTLRIRKTNVADHEIAKLGPENGAFGYVFKVLDSNGNPVPPRKPAGQWIKGGGPAIIRGTKGAVLQPDESWTNYAPLSEWYDLNKPGRYTIQVSQRVSSDPSAPVVESNKIALTVVP